MVFSLSALWWRRIRDLWKLPDGRRLRGKLGLVLMGEAMLSTSLILFSVDGWGCVPSLLFTWGQTMVEIIKIMVTSLFQKIPCMYSYTQCPNPAAGHRQPMPLLETPRNSQASLGQSLLGSLLLSHGSWWAQSSVCALQVSVSPVLCKFWGLHGGINCDLLQEVFCHTQVCCTQSPCPCGSPLLTRTSTGDTQTQFCLSLCGTEYILWNAKLEWSTSWNQDCREKYQ